MVRVLLLCPPVSLDGPLVRPRHAPHHTAIIAAALREAGHDVVVQDPHRDTNRLAPLVAAARAARPDVLLLMQSDYNRKIAPQTQVRVAQALRDGLPDVPMALYGRLDARTARKSLASVPAADVLLFGEPEFTVTTWVNAVRDGTEPLAAASAMAGAAWRASGDIELNDAERPDLDASPVPAWDLVPLSAYAFAPHQQAADVVFPVLASRGCPYPCFYCEVRARPRYIARSVDSVMDELRAIRDRYGARSVFFADPTFCIDRAWTLELCERLEAEAWDLRWSCMSRTDRVDDELLQAMARAGCWNILFGIESLNPDALEASNKAMDPATVGPALAAARRAGIETIASLMVGLPGDSPASFENTLNGLIELDPDFAQFFVLQLDGTKGPAGGRFLSEWQGAKHDFWGRVYASDSFDSEAQLQALRRRAFRRFYLRPRYIGGRVKALIRSDEPVAQLARVARGGLLAIRMAAGRGAA